LQGEAVSAGVFREPCPGLVVPGELCRVTLLFVAQLGLCLASVANALGQGGHGRGQRALPFGGDQAGLLIE
jgi:hypothetical protein